MEQTTFDSAAEFFQQNGVTIGFVPAVGTLESRCFREFHSNHPNFTMADVTYVCRKRLGVLPELTLTVFDILGVPRAKQFLVLRNETLDYGTLTNGVWSGAVAEIMAGFYQTSFPIFTPLEERLHVIDFSSSVLSFPATFTTRKPEDSNAIQVNPLSVLSVASWAAFFFVGILVALLLAFEQALNKKPLHHQSIISKWFDRATESVLLFTGFAVILHKPQRKCLNVPKVTFGLWTLAAAMVAGLYSGAILVKIMQQKTAVPFRDIVSLTECVEAGDCYIFMNGRTSNYHRLMKAQNLTAEEMMLHHAVLKNPIRFTKYISAEIFRYKYGPYPVFFTSKTISNSIQISDKKHSSHQYYAIDGGFPDPWCFPTRKNTTLTTLLSEAVRRARDVRK